MIYHKIKDLFHSGHQLAGSVSFNGRIVSVLSSGYVIKDRGGGWGQGCVNYKTNYRRGNLPALSAWRKYSEKD